jgi:triphosphoribosyl-dephospho-CoA synthetase
VRSIPFFKLLAILQVAMLARRHMTRLTPAERRRMADLVRRGHKLSKEERRELRELAAKLEPLAFARGAAVRMSPVPMGRRGRK